MPHRTRANLYTRRPLRILATDWLETRIIMRCSFSLALHLSTRDKMREREREDIVLSRRRRSMRGLSRYERKRKREREREREREMETRELRRLMHRCLCDMWQCMYMSECYVSLCVTVSGCISLSGFRGKKYLVSQTGLRGWTGIFSFVAS